VIPLSPYVLWVCGTMQVLSAADLRRNATILRGLRSLEFSLLDVVKDDIFCVVFVVLCISLRWLFGSEDFNFLLNASARYSFRQNQ